MKLLDHVQRVNLFGCHYFDHRLSIDECIYKIEHSKKLLDDILELETSYAELAEIRKGLSMFTQKTRVKKKISETFELAGAVNGDVTKIVKLYNNPSLSIEKKQKYVNLFALENGNSSKFSDSVEDFRKMIGLEIEFPN